MRSGAHIAALVAVLLCGFSGGLLMKRPGGTDPMAVGLAHREAEDDEGGSASRFVELSHAVRNHEQSRSSSCPGKGCTFVQNCSGEKKSLEKQLKKKAKKLSKQLKAAEKEYLTSHSKGELKVLKLESELEGINEKNRGGGNEGFSQLDEGQSDEE